LLSVYFDSSSSASAEPAPAAAPADVSTDTATSAAAAGPALGSCSDTLHDFVSNLINDGAAKAAYLADPLAALSSAGLGDISPADVQEVLPLIADSLPAGLPTDLSALPVDLGDLPLDLPAGVPGLDGLSGALPAVPGLDALTGALPAGVPGLDAVTGALPAVPGLDAVTGALPAVPGLDAVTGALPAVPGLDAVTGALPAVPGLDAVTGALPAVPGLDAVTGALPAVPGLDAVSGALPAGVPGLDALSGALPAVPGLDALSGVLPTSDLPTLSEAPMDGAPGLGALPVVGELPVGDLSSLPVDVPASLPSLPDLGSVGDLAHDVSASLPTLGDAVSALPVDVPQLPTLSAPVLGDVTAGVDDAAASLGIDGNLVSSANSASLTDPVFGTSTETAFGDVAAGANLDPQNFGGTGSVSTDLVDAAGGVSGSLGSDVSAWGGVATPAGDLAVGSMVSPEDGVKVAAQSPLGDLNLDLSTDGGHLSVTPGDVSDVLDTQNLGDTGDAVVGTVAHAVTVTGGVLADNVSSGSDGLGGLLTGTAGTVAHTLDTTAGTVSDGVQTGTDAVTDHAANLPSVDDLQVPQLPQVPDLAATDLPQVTDVTGGHLPAGLPSLPVDVPDVSGVTHGVTDLVSHNPVVDVVHGTPVGGVAEGVTDHLTQVTDHLGDLNLGL
jgi:hypothetical protein